jgi:membrane-bound metal-dependent hydrolase YbcI (DUF457 family)
MPLIVGHGLLGASIVAAAREPGPIRDDVKYWAFGAALGVLPDLDLFFHWILGLGIKWHGSFTHSFVFAVFVGWLASRVDRSRLQGVAIYSLAVFSHALLDAAVKKTYGGVALLWPFTDRLYLLGKIDYFAFYPGSNLEPLPELIWIGIKVSFYELLIFGPVFLGALLIRRIRQASRKRATNERPTE